MRSARTAAGAARRSWPGSATRRPTGARARGGAACAAGLPDEARLEVQRAVAAEEVVADVVLGRAEDRPAVAGGDGVALVDGARPRVADARDEDDAEAAAADALARGEGGEGGVVERVARRSSSASARGASGAPRRKRLAPPASRT